MKKIFSILILAALILGLLSGCGAEKAPAPEESPSAESSAGPEDTALKFTQEKVVKREKFLEKEDFADFLSRSEQGFLIPGLKQAIIPQGITYSEKTDRVYISNYSAVPDFPSVVSALDYESGELKAEYCLYNSDGTAFTSHVGGIAAAGDYIYISAKAKGDSYFIAKAELSQLPDEGRHDVIISELITVQTKPSFINYSGDYLWVGNFYHPKGDYELPKTFDKAIEVSGTEYGCIILGYKTDESGRLSMGAVYPEPELAVLGPDRIQGISFDGEKLYLSQSYGRKNDSSIIVHSFDPESGEDMLLDVCGSSVPAYVLEGENFVESINCMPMTEGLSLDKNGNLLILFESGAGKYDDGRDRTDTVWKLKLN